LPQHPAQQLACRIARNRIPDEFSFPLPEISSTEINNTERKVMSTGNIGYGFKSGFPDERAIIENQKQSLLFINDIFI
jgi:hypothetical protein